MKIWGAGWWLVWAVLGEKKRVNKERKIKVKKVCWGIVTELSIKRSFEFLCLKMPKPSSIPHPVNFVKTLLHARHSIYESIKPNLVDTNNHIFSVTGLEIMHFDVFEVTFFFFCLFQGCSHGTWRFPAQGSNWSCSHWPTTEPQQRGIQARSAAYTTAHGNAGSLTH